MNHDNAVQYSNAANELIDLLEHIAWEQTVKPALDRHAETYKNLLVQSVLGRPIVNHDGTPMSKEILAGRIEGIEWLERFIISVLKRGERGDAYLRSEDT